MEILKGTIFLIPISFAIAWLFIGYSPVTRVVSGKTRIRFYQGRIARLICFTAFLSMCFVIIIDAIRKLTGVKLIDIQAAYLPPVGLFGAMLLLFFISFTFKQILVDLENCYINYSSGLAFIFKSKKIPFRKIKRFIKTEDRDTESTTYLLYLETDDRLVKLFTSISETERNRISDIICRELNFPTAEENQETFAKIERSLKSYNQN